MQLVGTVAAVLAAGQAFAQPTFRTFPGLRAVTDFTADGRVMLATSTYQVNPGDPLTVEAWAAMDDGTRTLVYRGFEWDAVTGITGDGLTAWGWVKPNGGGNNGWAARWTVGNLVPAVLNANYFPTSVSSDGLTVVGAVFPAGDEWVWHPATEAAPTMIAGMPPTWALRGAIVSKNGRFLAANVEGGIGRWDLQTNTGMTLTIAGGASYELGNIADDGSVVGVYGSGTGAASAV